jgi:fructokinase
MITVCGEVVTDLVAHDNGVYRAHPGGSPANVAVALARLGDDVSFAGRIGADVFGRAMRTHLESNGVDPRHLVRATQPSTLAVVSFDDQRRAAYDFWTEGTADWQWSATDLAIHPAADVVAFHTGSLASWTPPGSAALLDVFRRARSTGKCTLSYDPNVRARLLGDVASARVRIEAMASLAHVVKVSDEDLAWLFPGEDVLEVARRWVTLGPELVVVTLGAGGALAVRRGSESSLEELGRAVSVVDTIGAGDTFTAGLLHSLGQADALGQDPATRLAALSERTLRGILRTACAAAALTCTRPGCDPPTRAELDAFAHRRRDVGDRGQRK